MVLAMWQQQDLKIYVENWMNQKPCDREPI